MDINKLCPYCMTEVDKEGNTTCPHCGCDFSKVFEVRHQLKPYTILAGKYLVGGVLGEGGFGITYLGFDLNLEIRVAIKEFYPNGYATRESQSTNALTAYAGKNMDTVYKWRDNFLKEARSLAKCSHLSGVVGVKDFFQENNTAYIVQEYLEGKTLKKYCKERGGKLPVEQLLNSLEPVILALGEVHKEGLIHRDISPDNIMLLKGGQMKLLDFGAARDFNEEGEKSLSVLLKPGYAPEEQYRTKGNQGPWSDIYAMAGTIYKCITGITPPESMERMRKDELQKPSALGIAIPPHIEKTLLKAMEVYAEKRYQTIEEFHKALYAQKLPVTVAGNNNLKPSSQVVSVSVNKEQLTKIQEEIKEKGHKAYEEGKKYVNIFWNKAKEIGKNLKNQIEISVRKIKEWAKTNEHAKLIISLSCVVIVIAIVVIIKVIITLSGVNKNTDIVNGKTKPVRRIEQSVETEEKGAVKEEASITIGDAFKRAKVLTLESLLKVAENNIALGMYEDALNEINQIKVIDKLNEDAYLYEADIYLKQNNYNSALNVLNTGISIVNSEEMINRKNDICSNIVLLETVSGDGQHIFYNTYDESGRLIREELYDSEQNFNGWNEYKYNEEGCKRYCYLYNKKGNLEKYSKYSYDDNLILTTIKDYNSKDKKQGWHEYSYDSSGRVIEILDYGANKKVGWKTISEYDSAGRLIRNTGYDSKNRAKSWVDTVYDENGNVDKMIRYDEDGEVVEWNQTFYDENNKATESISYNEDDEIINSTKYFYDGNGFKEKEIYYNAAGEETGYAEYDLAGKKISEKNPTTGNAWNYKYQYMAE